MNKNKTELMVVVDRSGSMSGKDAETIGGFNAFIEEQRLQPGEATVTMVQFDHEYLKTFDRVPLAQVPPLTAETYQPRGYTALYDAIGKTVDEVGWVLAKLPEAERPGTVIVAILTDGFENASKEYTRARLAQMIDHQRTHYNWQFIFLASDLGAMKDAAALNIAPNMIFANADSCEGTTDAYQTLSRSVSQLRAS